MTTELKWTSATPAISNWIEYIRANRANVYNYSWDKIVQSELNAELSPRRPDRSNPIGYLYLQFKTEEELTIFLLRWS